MISQIDIKKLLSWIPVFVFYGLAVNFAIFFVLSLLLGGTADNGMITDGKYYLGDHGKFREVSKAVFVFSEAYTRFTMDTFPLAFVAFPFLFLNESIRAKLQGKKKRNHQ